MASETYSDYRNQVTAILNNARENLVTLDGIEEAMLSIGEVAGQFDPSEAINGVVHIPRDTEIDGAIIGLLSTFESDVTYGQCSAGEAHSVTCGGLEDDGTLFVDGQYVITWDPDELQVYPDRFELLMKAVTNLLEGQDVNRLLIGVCQLSISGSLTADTLRAYADTVCTSNSGVIKQYVNVLSAAIPAGRVDTGSAVQLLQYILSGWDSAAETDNPSTYAFTTPPQVDTSPLFVIDEIVGIVGSVATAVATYFLGPIAAVVGTAVGVVASALSRAITENNNDYPLTGNIGTPIRMFNAPVCQVTVPAVTLDDDLVARIKQSPTGAVVLFHHYLTIVLFARDTRYTMIGVEAFLTDHCRDDDYPGSILTSELKTFFTPTTWSGLFNGALQAESQQTLHLLPSIASEGAGAVEGTNAKLFTSIRYSAFQLARGVMSYDSKYSTPGYYPPTLGFSSWGYEPNVVTKWFEDLFNVGQTLSVDTAIDWIANDYLGIPYRVHQMSGDDPIDANDVLFNPLGFTDAKPYTVWAGLVNELTVAFRMYFSAHSEVAAHMVNALWDCISSTNNTSQFAGWVYYDSDINPTTCAPKHAYSLKQRVITTAAIATASAVAIAVGVGKAKSAVRKFQAKSNAKLLAARQAYNSDPSNDNLKALTRAEWRANVLPGFLGVEAPVDQATSIQIGSGYTDQFSLLYRALTGQLPQ